MKLICTQRFYFMRSGLFITLFWHKQELGGNLPPNFGAMRVVPPPPNLAVRAEMSFLYCRFVFIDEKVK